MRRAVNLYHNQKCETIDIKTEIIILTQQNISIFQYSYSFFVSIPAHHCDCLPLKKL